MFSEKIDSIFAKIKVKSFSEEEMKAQFEQEELDELKTASSELDGIELQLKDTFLEKSKLAKFLFHFRNSLQTDRTSKRNINKIKDKDSRQFINLIYEYFEKVANEDTLNDLHEKLMTLIKAKFPIESDQTNIEVALIDSVFFDYKSLNELRRSWMALNPNIKVEFLEIWQDFIELINNGAELWGESEADFIHKTNVIYKSKKKVSNLIMMRSLVRGLFDSINPIKELNEKVLENSITKECLTELFTLLDELKFDEIENHEFGRLKPIFLKQAHLSQRSKQLILHDIFLLFGHPSAMSEEDEDNLIGKVDHRTCKDTEQMKTRMIEKLVGKLE
jgi:hypothetical protein